MFSLPDEGYPVDIPAIESEWGCCMTGFDEILSDAR